ncbi:hypothetical protein HanRHA438_Chr12g0563761 [Helianthus annuus]|nr:hypothetical protein HanRHA438_Chr12g0563761 [Helianthus annuus]
MGPSVASYPLAKNLAPINFRLQLLTVKFVPASHAPFHALGAGPIPVSSKLLLSGQTPVSKTPMTTSLSPSDCGNKLLFWSSPRNSGVRVVWSSYFNSGKTEIIPGGFQVTRLPER